MRYLTLLLVLFWATTSSCSSLGQGSEIHSTNPMADARNAYSRTDHARAYPLFKQVWDDQSLPLKDRVEAGRMLAKMDWRFYGKNKKALDLIAEIEKLDHEKSLVYILKSRILVDENELDKALTWSEKAISESKSETEKFKASTMYATQVLHKAQKDILSGSSELKSVQSNIEKTHSMLSDLLKEQQDNIELANLYLGSSLILKNGVEAFKAWKQYYRVDDSNPAHSSLIKSVEDFGNALNDYNGGESNTIKIIKGLAESGFYKYAALVKHIEIGPGETEDSRINEIVDFASFLKEIREASLDFYQGTTTTETDIYDYNARLKEISKSLWDKLQWPSSKPSFSQSLFQKEVRKRFKALMTHFTSNGSYGLHLGQVILEDRRLICQHGQSAEFKYLIIDHMVSNGYSSWFADGENEVGGWSGGDGAFLQVRTTMITAPKMIWSLVSDPVEIKSLEERVQKLSAQDDAIARKNPYTFLPGLQWRLVQRETNEILDSLKSRGLSRGDLRFAFITTIERIFEGSAVYAHEGRHAIDQKNGYSTVSKELEYTAKLSELYFSEKPFLSIHPILQRNIGHSTSHGQANLRVVTELVKWMEAHKNEIDGFDSSRPTLPQLDRLTDRQLKRAIKSLDPMAN